MGKRLGLTEAQLHDLPDYERSDAFDAKAKATLRYADYVTQQAGSGQDNMLEELRTYFNEGEIVELTLTICMANFTNRFNNALGHVPDIGEP